MLTFFGALQLKRWIFHISVVWPE